jgi:hypothetical protein
LNDVKYVVINGKYAVLMTAVEEELEESKRIWDWQFIERIDTLKPTNILMYSLLFIYVFRYKFKRCVFTRGEITTRLATSPGVPADHSVYPG